MTMRSNPFSAKASRSWGQRGPIIGSGPFRPSAGLLRPSRVLMLGSSIGGHILILQALGQGGMGEVYAGVDERLGRRVAVKAIRADRTAGARARFLREARALSALDHPNICRIYEYIESPEGDFLVLELIEGTTLGRAIEQGLSDQRKLRIAEKILEALVAAHRKGIVHRDLKPDNVMITPDGTVKVLDFGIAQLQALDSEPADASPDQPERLPDDKTQIFRIVATTVRLEEKHTAIVGTPGYMSPEQARGGEITTASDLYSFGLMLQDLLGEEESYERSLPAGRLIELAARGESRPLTGQPRDITALVTSLKALAPGDRPTAQDALAALRRILDAPRRRIRYAAAIAILAVLLAGAIKYALDITAARAEAELRRHQAEGLVRFMVGDLWRKLEPVGRLDVLDDTASRALSYFASLSPEKMTAEDLKQNAQALAQLGQARVKQGKLPEAVDLFRQSVRFGSAAVRRDPSSEEAQLALSNAHFWLGDALRRSGDAPGTLQNFQSYFAISRLLAQRHPQDPKFQAEISYAHGNLGAAYELADDFPRTLAEYRTACALDRERLRREPGDEQWQADLANSTNRLGVVLQKTGDFRGARSAFDESLAIRRRRYEEKPGDAIRRRQLSVSLAYSGMLQLATGDVAQASRSFGEEAEMATELAAGDPSNADSRRNRDVARARLASLLDPARGVPMIDEAMADLRALVREDGRIAWRRDLAFVLIRSAKVELDLGRLSRARSDAGEALAMSERFVEENPTESVSIRMLGEALLAAAQVEERMGQPRDADARRTRVLELTSKLPPDPIVSAMRVRALLALGREAEAAPLAATLVAGGYKDPEFTAALARRHSSSHPPPSRTAP